MGAIKILNGIDVLVTTVVAIARLALRVLVCEGAAKSLNDS